LNIRQVIKKFTTYFVYVYVYITYTHTHTHTHKAKFALEQTMKTQRARSGYLYSLTPALDGGRWSPPRPERFTPGRERPVPLVQEAEWAPRPVWKAAENLTPHQASIPVTSGP